jgi:hypothetical protein
MWTQIRFFLNFETFIFYRTFTNEKLDELSIYLYYFIRFIPSNYEISILSPKELSDVGHSLGEVREWLKIHISSTPRGITKRDYQNSNNFSFCYNSTEMAKYYPK